MVGIKDPSCMMYALEIDDMLYTTRDLGLLSYLYVCNGQKEPRIGARVRLEFVAANPRNESSLEALTVCTIKRTHYRPTRRNLASIVVGYMLVVVRTSHRNLLDLITTIPFPMQLKKS